MPCYYPILVKNKHYDGVHAVRATTHGEPRYIYVPCGNCIGCLKKRRQDWNIRLQNEFHNSSSAYCITLTYDDEHCPYTSNYDIGKYVAIHGYLPELIPNLKYEDTQNWKKHLRTLVSRKLKNYKGYDISQLKFFIAPEYGGLSGRPHYHVLIFNWPQVLDLYSYVIKTWHKGMFLIDILNEATINYVTKYVLKPPKYYKEIGQVAPRALCSPNLGKTLSQRTAQYYRDNLLERKVIRKNGFSYAIPRAYRDKLLTESERYDLSLDYINKYTPLQYKFSKGCLRAIDRINHKEINKIIDNL